MKKLIVLALLAIPLYLIVNQGDYYGFQSYSSLHAPYFTMESNPNEHIYHFRVSHVSLYVGYYRTPSGSALCIGDANACSIQGVR